MVRLMKKELALIDSLMAAGGAEINGSCRKREYVYVGVQCSIARCCNIVRTGLLAHGFLLLLCPFLKGKGWFPGQCHCATGSGRHKGRGEERKEGWI